MPGSTIPSGLLARSHASANCRSVFDMIVSLTANIVIGLSLLKSSGMPTFNNRRSCTRNRFLVTNGLVPASAWVRRRAALFENCGARLLDYMLMRHTSVNAPPSTEFCVLTAFHRSSH